MSSVHSSFDPFVMEDASPSMIRCGNWRDTRWIATWSHPSASWTPNPSQRPKQAMGAAEMGEKGQRAQTAVLG
jgi:hypothetical protein